VSGIVRAYGGSGGSSNNGGAAGGTASTTINLNKEGNVTADAYANYTPVVGIQYSPQNCGGNANVSGSGGAGGASTSSASATSTLLISNTDNAVAVAGATGGVGGFGTLGNGGAGGSATSTASALTHFAGNASAEADAYGGAGGRGYGTGFAGGAGGTATITGVTASSGSGTVSVKANAVGGAGGMGFSGAPGANGVSETLNNVVSGSTTGELDLFQQAVGGAGGRSDELTAGAGGNGSSTLTLTNTTSSFVQAYVDATGGGSDFSPGGAANGGSATATANISVSQKVNVTLVSAAGGGSYGTPGSGGTAVSNGTGSSTDTASGQSAVTVTSTAYGATGGSGFTYTGSGGPGSNGTATATASGVGLDPVSATASASGGDGGAGAGTGYFTGNGGNGQATATATNTLGTAYASATSYGGASPFTDESGVFGSHTTPGTMGSANSQATATSPTWAQADAAGSTSYDTPAFGSSLAVADSPSTDLISFVKSTATAPTDLTAASEAVAANNQPILSTSSLGNFGAAAWAVGSPKSTDVTSAWSSASHVSAAFNNNAANVNMLAITGMYYPDAGSGTTNTYSSVIELNENNAQLTGNGLIIGLTSGSATFNLPGDSLRFRVERNSVTLVDQTFTTTASIQSYFQNAALDLGPENASLGGANLDLQLIFDFTSANNDDSVSAEVVVGNDSNAQIGTWAHSTGGSWSTPGDWSANTLPDGAGTQALFGSAISSPQTVTLDQNTTIGNIQFNNTSAYTIASGTGGYSLTLDNAGAAATIGVSAGNHTISAPLQLTSAGLSVTVAAGDTLTAAGKISGAAPLSLNGAGTFKFGASIGEVDLTGLTIASGATLDLNNNHIILAYGSSDPISTIAGYIKAGYNGGHWNGPGIIASAAQTPTNGLFYGVGYADSKDNVVAGLTSGQIEIKYTLLGDANLDGLVNGSDFNILAANFNQSITGWDQGDFNYDGLVNATDFNELAANFNQGVSGAATAGDVAALDAFAVANGLSMPTSDVPEPASAGMMVMAGLGILQRRRRR
jgi:hypothetical protein